VRQANEEYCNSHLNDLDCDDSEEYVASMFRVRNWLNYVRRLQGMSFRYEGIVAVSHATSISM
jgi:hypothetical protein